MTQSGFNIYYLTGTSEAHVKAVLIGLYEATTGATLPVDQVTGEKLVPQNDGVIQFNDLFGDEEIRPPQGMASPLPSGFHVALAVRASVANPQGVIGPQDTAMLLAAGIDIKRADQIDATYLPKFQ